MLTITDVTIGEEILEKCKITEAKILEADIKVTI